MHNENPLGAIPYLWWSHDIEVTPGNVKSNYFTPYTPNSLAKGITNEPRHESTCNPTSYFKANSAKAGISS